MTFTASFGPSAFSGSNNLPNFNVGVRVAPAALAFSGAAVRVVLAAGNNSGLSITSCALDGHQLLFQGQPGFSIGPGQEITSDPLNQAFDRTVEHLFKAHVASSGQVYSAEGALPSGCQTFWKVGADESQNDSVVGYSSYGMLWMLRAIEVADAEVPPGEEEPPPSPTCAFQRFILASEGQSGADGGRALPLVPATTYLHRSRLFNFTMAGQLEPAVEPLGSEAGSLWPDLNDNDGATQSGFLMAAGNRLAEKMPAAHIMLVAAAKGATDADAHLPGTSLHAAKIDRILAAMEQWPDATVLIVGEQGVSDSNTLDRARAWAAKIVEKVKALRDDLGRPNVPYVLAGLHQNPQDSRFPYWEHLQTVQECSRFWLPGINGFASAKDLSGMPGDLGHLGPEGVQVLGQRIGDEFIRILSWK